MTVLEKIKRCVELVWDFEEMYDWSDIEAFCGAELSTYPQHDEILDYFKRIAELEKENAELKARVENQKSFLERIRAKFELGEIDRKEIEGYIESEHLTKAKELLAKWVELFKPKGGNIPPTPIQVETEQFLSEVEK